VYAQPLFYSTNSYLVSKIRIVLKFSLIFSLPNIPGMEEVETDVAINENLRNAGIVLVLFAMVALISYLEWRGRA
jgi:hypothetical protein